jgi:hypothetical protein
MTYQESVLEYKKEFNSIAEVVKNTDDIFSQKYFSGGSSEKTFSPPFIPGEIYSFPYPTDSQVTEKRKFIDRNPVVLCTDSHQTNENGVILMAAVADALEIFSNPSEILGAVFTDPAKALTAVANIGADMTDATRKESQKVVVAAVIAAQILTTASMVGRVR